jgi:hypothetical protein
MLAAERIRANSIGNALDMEEVRYHVLSDELKETHGVTVVLDGQ